MDCSYRYYNYLSDKNFYAFQTCESILKLLTTVLGSNLSGFISANLQMNFRCLKNANMRPPYRFFIAIDLQKSTDS